MGARIIFLERQDIGDVGTAPTINGLIRIPDDTQILMCLCEKFDERILGTVRILILIDMDVLEFLLIERQHVRCFLE